MDRKRRAPEGAIPRELLQLCADPQSNPTANTVFRQQANQQNCQPVSRQINKLTNRISVATQAIRGEGLAAK
eukprot:8182845-Pyramimonas_sp.AAC.1